MDDERGGGKSTPTRKAPEPGLPAQPELLPDAARRLLPTPVTDCRFGAVEAHRSYERFEQGHQVAAGGEGGGGPHYGRNAAMVVALMAAFLVIPTFLSNEAVEEAITGGDPRARHHGRLEAKP